MKKECIVLVYNSFSDPLFQNLMYQYMLDLIAHTDWTFHLITYEQAAYKVKDKQEVIERLNEQGITWHPRSHRTGKFLIFKKALDGLSVFVLIAKLRAKGVRVIWSFANLAASFGYIYSRLLGFKTVIYSYEPHSQFMAELGLWNRSSLKFKILNYLEWKAGLDANYVLTGTKYMVEELKRKGAKGEIYRAPTSVDENVFVVDEELRSTYRKRLNAEDKNILIYLGKFGGLYYDEEIYQLIKLVDSSISNMFFVIATPDNPEEIRNKLSEVGIDDNSRVMHLTKVKDVVGCLNAADIGLNAIPPSPSQKYRSPTKVAEYLLCGLPFITCKGISEDDIYAETYCVGVVLNSFNDVEISLKLGEVERLLENRGNLAKRCREVGIKYRAKSNVTNQLLAVFERLEN